MPNLTEDEIKARIADGSIFAISVDTSIFDRYGCNLTYPALRKLDQFQGGQVRVLLSEIVEKEVRSHIKRDAEETQRALQTAINQHKKRWKLTDAQAAAPQSYGLEVDPKTVAQQQVADFVAAVGAEIVPATEPASVPAEVLRRYFASESPFEEGDKKKHEFPDAFALLSLEAKAAQANRLILCVSRDKGWKGYTADSQRLICVDDITRALALFNEAGRIVAEQAVARLRAGTAPEMLGSIESALEARLDDNDFEPDASAPTEFEAEPTGAIVQVINRESASDPVVIATDSDTVTFTMAMHAIVGFEANFSYLVRDPIDRDYVRLGSESEYIEEDIEFEVAVTVVREQEGEGEPELLDAEVTLKRLTVDFGYVEPFRNEDPTHEKY